MRWFDLFQRSRPQCAPAKSRNRVQLTCESLENRLTPSGLDVLTPAVDLDPPPDEIEVTSWGDLHDTPWDVYP
jgi:hypothetical protein